MAAGLPRISLPGTSANKLRITHPWQLAAMQKARLTQGLGQRAEPLDRLTPGGRLVVADRLSADIYAPKHCVPPRPRPVPRGLYSPFSGLVRRVDEERSLGGPQQLGGDAAEPHALHRPQPPAAHGDERLLSSSVLGGTQDASRGVANVDPDPGSAPQRLLELRRPLF